MTPKGVEEKPSESALIAALRRTIACQEYQGKRFGQDYLAEVFLPFSYRFLLKFNQIRANTKAKLDALFPGMTEFIIARTVYFDGLFAAALMERTPQIVLLGAGYDSRACRFAKLNDGTKIYELDIAPTQERKKQCLKRANIQVRRQVKFVPIDFNRESLQDVLDRAGWQPQQETLFIWEGVTYYLLPEAVEAVLEFISRAAQKDSTIAFDYSIPLTEDNWNDYYGAKEFVHSMREYQANEAILFSIGEGEIESYLAQQNLRLIEHLDNNEIERKYLINDNETLIGKIPGHLRFVIAAPIILEQTTMRS